MGRGMVLNKRRRPVTQKDLKQAEARWEGKLEEHKMDAASRGTKAAFGLMFLALYHLYGWKWKAAVKIQDEVDRIADLVAAGDLTWEDIVEELRSIGIGLEI